MFFPYTFKKTIEKYRYKITVETSDVSVLKCLCTLSKIAQKTGNAAITCPKTNFIQWENNDHKITFRFTDNIYRSTFLTEATRILPSDLWKICSQNTPDLL
jgi:hypothetical protein